jgi:hypothetical protein
MSCNVGLPPVAPTCTITADPDTFLSGETKDIVVTWTTANATTATINGVATPPNVTGSQIFPGVSTTTTFTLAVTGALPGGPCTATASVIVPPVGGLVPCGRLGVGDDPTNIDMRKPCTICAMFYMIKRIINFVLELSIIFSVFIIILSGLLYAFSAGNPRKTEKAKTTIGKTMAGISIIFIAWLCIAVILQVFGYANVSVWNQVNCTLPT